MGSEMITEHDKLGSWLALSLDHIKEGRGIAPFLLKLEHQGKTKKDICLGVIHGMEARTSKGAMEIKAMESGRKKLFKEVDALPQSFSDFYYAFLYYLLMKKRYSEQSAIIPSKLAAIRISSAHIKSFRKAVLRPFKRLLSHLDDKSLKVKFENLQHTLLAQIDGIGTGISSNRVVITKEEITERLAKAHDKIGYDETKYQEAILKVERDVLKKAVQIPHPAHRKKNPILIPLTIYLVELITNLPETHGKSKGKAFRLASDTFNLCFFPATNQTEEHIRLSYAHHWGRKHRMNQETFLPRE